MLRLHSLAYSRAIRVLWLLEELAVPCDLVTYRRTEANRAPAELKTVHPLGKSPVIEDGDLVLAESATILRYITETHGDGRFVPDKGSADYWLHEEWLDYVESTFALPMLLPLYARWQSNPALDTDRAKADRKTHLTRIAERLEGRDYLMGEELTLADIQMSYILALGTITDQLTAYPAVDAYWQRLQARPAFRRAVERAGPMTAPAPSL